MSSNLKREFDAKPFMDELNKQGLPWKIIEMKSGESYKVGEI